MDRNTNPKRGRFGVGTALCVGAGAYVGWEFSHELMKAAGAAILAEGARHLVWSALLEGQVARMRAGVRGIGGISVLESALFHRRAAQEIASDLGRSPLISRTQGEEAHRECLGQLRRGGLPFGPFTSPIPWPSDTAFLGTHSTDAVRALRTHSDRTPIEVRTSSIYGAGIGLVGSLRSVGVRLTVRHDSIHGPDMLSSLESGTQPDFLLLPAGPMAFGSPSRTAFYRYLLPVFWKPQSVLVRQEDDAAPPKRKFVLGASTGDLQSRDGSQAHLFGETRRVDTSEIHRLAQGSLDHGQGLVAWEPSASYLCRKYGLKARGEFQYKRWVCLFAHERWLHPSMERRLAAFVHVLISSVKSCQCDPWLPKFVLSQPGLKNSLWTATALGSEKLTTRAA